MFKGISGNSLVMQLCMTPEQMLLNLSQKLRSIDPALIDEPRYENVSIIKKIALNIFYSLNRIFYTVFFSLRSDMENYSSLSKKIISLKTGLEETKNMARLRIDQVILKNIKPCM